MSGRETSFVEKLSRQSTERIVRCAEVSSFRANLQLDDFGADVKKLDVPGPVFVTVLAEEGSHHDGFVVLAVKGDVNLVDHIRSNDSRRQDEKLSA